MGPNSWKWLCEVLASEKNTKDELFHVVFFYNQWYCIQFVKKNTSSDGKITHADIRAGTDDMLGFNNEIIVWSREDKYQ